MKRVSCAVMALALFCGAAQAALPTALNLQTNEDGVSVNITSAQLAELITSGQVKGLKVVSPEAYQKGLESGRLKTAELATGAGLVLICLGYGAAYLVAQVMQCAQDSNQHRVDYLAEQRARDRK